MAQDPFRYFKASLDIISDGTLAKAQYADAVMEAITQSLMPSAAQGAIVSRVEFGDEGEPAPAPFVTLGTSTEPDAHAVFALEASSPVVVGRATYAALQDVFGGGFHPDWVAEQMTDAMADDWLLA